jgi:hypothetical protein
MTKKSKHGGARSGAGRRTLVSGGMSEAIYFRCSLQQKEAIARYVSELSRKRTARGLPAVDISTWLRELALKHSGNSQLSAAAAAKRAANDRIV